MHVTNYYLLLCEVLLRADSLLCCILSIYDDVIKMHTITLIVIACIIYLRSIRLQIVLLSESAFHNNVSSRGLHTICSLCICASVPLMSPLSRRLLHSPCRNSIKHASVDVEWAYTCGVDPREPLCMELSCQGLVDADCTKLGGTIVYETVDTKQPCS